MRGFLCVWLYMAYITVQVGHAWVSVHSTQGSSVVQEGLVRVCVHPPCAF